MRFAFVPVMLLVCSSINAAAATATTDPSIEPQRIDVSRPVAPPTNVKVLNFPEVQAVEGSVAVSNLPSVQTVGGIVSVGNLPLDADGAVRVTSAPAPARQMVVHDLLETPLDCNGNVLLPAYVNVNGYSNVGVHVRGDEGIRVELLSRWSADEDFRSVADYRNGVNAYGASGCWGLSVTRLLCPAVGGEVAVHLYCPSSRPVLGVRVYLVP